MTQPAPSKADLRRRMKMQRDAIALAQRLQWSDAIRRRVLAAPRVIVADSVFCYVSIGSEVDTHDLIRSLLEAGKTVAVPRLADPDRPGEMIAQPIRSLDDLVTGLYGFPQPPAIEPRLDHPCDVTLVPGLAFTRTGHRLGYGAGHYDRYFAANPDTWPIGLCFEQQILPSVPTQPHDRRMREIITQGA